MAGNEESGLALAPSPAPSHSSQDSGGAHALKAKKDRPCPFCRQYFTSSSLGRHLDLYIKDKNPKPPDGVHNVDQIRKMRGSITRRQTKHSLTKRMSSPSMHSSKSPLSNDTPPHVARSPVNSPHRISQPRLPVNWQATGVINNLPPRNSASSSTGPQANNSKSIEVITASDIQQHWHEDKDTAKAAEMALREVLRIVQAATARVQKPQLFDFDPLTLNFPALCLRILSPPKMLFSTTPSATSHSWPITVPDHTTFEILHREVSERVCHWRRDRKLHNITSSDHADGTNGVTGLGYPIEPESQPLFDHLQATWTSWQKLSETVRQESWQLEILRAYSEERSHRLESEKQMMRVQLELEQLRAHTDGILNGPPGRPYRAIHSPMSQPTQQSYPYSWLVSPEAATELRRSGLDPVDWEYDTLISRWKDIIQGTRKGGSGQSSFYPGYTAFGSNHSNTAHRVASPIARSESNPQMPSSAPVQGQAPIPASTIYASSIENPPWINKDKLTSRNVAPLFSKHDWDGGGQGRQQTQPSQLGSEQSHFDGSKGTLRHMYPPYSLLEERGGNGGTGRDGDVEMDIAHERDGSAKRKRSGDEEDWRSEK